MAYTEPPAVTTGELMEAADWNTYERADMIALYAGEMSLASQAANDLQYATSATQWARIAAVANGVLSYSGAGVPSASTTLPSGLAIPSPTLTTPALGTPASGTLTNCTGYPVSALAGTTLPAAVVSSSLTSVGTVTGGTWSSNISGATLTGALTLNGQTLGGTATIGGGAAFYQHVLNGSTGVGLQFQRTTATAQTWEIRVDTDRSWKLVDITDASAVAIEVVFGSQNVLFPAAEVILGATKRLFFDAGNDTYWSEVSANTLNAVVGGVTTLSLTATGMTFAGTIAGTYTLGGTVTLASPIVSGAAPATPTANVVYADTLIKAWAYITVSGGAPTIAADVNVGSVTDSDVGDWTVNYATALPAAYAVLATPVDVAATYTTTHGAPGTGSVRIRMWDAGDTPADVGISVACLG